jgi:hypothetical protein
MPTAVKMARKVLGLSPAAEPEPTEAPQTETGFQISRSRGTRSSTITRWGVRALVLVLLYAGVNQVLVKPLTGVFGGDAAPPAPVVRMVDPDQARLAAARFTGDYLSYTGTPTEPTALRQDLVPTADPTRMAFTGAGTITADLVIPGAVTSIDPTHATVAVLAHVLLGHTAAAWLPLLIPVAQSGDQVLVDVPGPIFSPDRSDHPAAAGDDDPTTTEATRTWAKTFFTGYAASSTSASYLSAPGFDLQGLHGVVTAADMTSWKLTAPGPDGARSGTARVTWQLVGDDLATLQTYSVTVRTADSRWFATTLGTSTAN